MKQSISLLFAVIIVSFSFTAKAQSEAEMKKWTEYMTPSLMQKMMAKWDGTWNESITMWMIQGAPEQKMETTGVNKMILGGRYQESKHTGTMMGMPFEGLGTTGWDNAGKHFVSSWVDNFGTGMLYMEGPWDEAKKTMTLKGKMVDPMTGKLIALRQVVKVIDDNTQLMEQFTEKDGKEFKNMEIKMTRKQ